MDYHHSDYYATNRNETNLEKRIFKWSILLWTLEQL
jgi:hypothetical protein